MDLITSNRGSDSISVAFGLGDGTFVDAEHYLVGVGPLRSDKAAEYMRTRVPGVHIPDAIVERLRKTPKEKQRQEGKQICVEIIEQVREIAGVAGIHIMAYKQQDLVPAIVEEAGLLPRPLRDDVPETAASRVARSDV